MVALGKTKIGPHRVFSLLGKTPAYQQEENGELLRLTCLPMSKRENAPGPLPRAVHQRYAITDAKTATEQSKGFQTGAMQCELSHALLTTDLVGPIQNGYRAVNQLYNE